MKTERVQVLKKTGNMIFRRFLVRSRKSGPFKISSLFASFFWGGSFFFPYGGECEPVWEGVGGSTPIHKTTPLWGGEQGPFSGLWGGAGGSTFLGVFQKYTEKFVCSTPLWEGIKPAFGMLHPIVGGSKPDIFGIGGSWGGACSDFCKSQNIHDSTP